MIDTRAICQDISAADAPLLVQKQVRVGPPGPDEVLVHFLAAPINMQDELVVRKLYPVKPVYAAGTHTVERNSDTSTFPILGYDGAAKVVECGENVAALRPGDLVVPRKHGLGTWRSAAVVAADDMVAVPSDMDPRFASLLKMVYTVAYLLATKEAELKPGECIILNAATGRIAQSVVQFATLAGVRAICVVRDDKDDASMAHLSKLGAYRVLRERDVDPAALHAQLPITLAIDSVFGASGARLVESLSNNGTYLSLGYLGREQTPAHEFSIPLTEDLLFRRAIKFRNFRLSDRLRGWSDAELRRLWVWFGELHKEHKLALPALHLIPWSAENCLDAVNATIQHNAQKLQIHTRPLIFFDQ